MALPSAVTARLAPELYDLFIDEFRSSKFTLSNCSLVCKAWLPRCRRHLFYSATLRPDFVNFLRSSSHATATVVPHIRSIGLGGMWMREQQDESYDIIMFMTTLEHLQRIQMETWSWSYLAPPATTALLSGPGRMFQTLRVLDLQFIQFPSFAILRTFASRFDGLQQLIFDNVTWDVVDADASQSDDPPPFLSRLHTLKLVACSNTPILSWLSNGAPSVAPIRSLNLPEILPCEASVIGPFLSSIVSSLENLELGFLAHNPEDTPALRDAIGEIDLSLHTRLRTICVHQLSLFQFPSSPSSPTTPPPGADVSPYIWLVPFFARIAPTELSQITFNIWLGGESQLDLIDWTALAGVLSDLTKLHVVQLRVRGMDKDMQDNVKGWIGHRLRDWGRAQECLQVLLLE
ncbi:hypothetical protein FB45DRAFT_742343 [Roridomyces roridus]|uniref:Uncharacterized protein n=1 Tax=Roridomyces roridus TaxID=1738132 RepID=A0AAD7C2I5_9AGAR|nr:hypothetical protein FB45DRAFT_742343 [Roridomyces roridus]